MLKKLTPLEPMNFIPCRHKNLILLPVLILVILSINCEAIWAALHHRYYVYNQDSYMHMVIASNFLKNPQWYQHFNPNINTPFGITSHSWTQVFNLLLVNGALVFQLIMPLSKALYVWCFLLPMIFNLIALYAMLWTIKILKPTPYQQLFIVIAFLVNPFLGDLFTPLNVDYDFLLITLSIFYWGCLLRLIVTHKNIWAISMAIIAGLGIWISVSFIIMVFIGLSFIAQLSLRHPRTNGKQLTLILAVLCVFLTGAIRLEHPHFLTIAYDILSIVHLTFFLLLLLGTGFYLACAHNTKKTANLILIALILIVIFFIMNYLFPGFYYGPYNQVSSDLLVNFFPRLSEFYSPFAIDSSIALAIVSYFIIGVGFLYYLFLDNQRLELHMSLLLWAACVTLFFTLVMYRWNEFTVPLLIILMSFFVAAWCNTTKHTLIKLIIVTVMAFLPSLILFQEKTLIPVKAASCLQQFHTMLEDNYLESPQFNHDKSLLIHSNYGPLILYYTHYAIIAANDHQNPQGVKDSFNFFNANEEQAKQIIKRRTIDLILLCQAEHSTHFNPDKSPWLLPIALPKKYAQWNMYRIKR